MYVGFDTSNYTTSAAVFDGKNMTQAKQLLTVKDGERGLRQSDAVFQHTVNMPKLLEQLGFGDVEAVGVSVRPRGTQGSYMPCFLVGEGIAEAFSRGAHAPLYKTSHQVGHILAALYGSGRLDLAEKEHIAFHLSGGTTEALLVTPDKTELLKAEIIAQSLDLKAGQAIDRAGVMLGMRFPCGKELDRLSALSDKEYAVRPSMKGTDCSLSGIENKAKQLLENGENKENIAKFVLSSVCAAVVKMTEEITARYGSLPLVFSGGVSSNTMLRNEINKRFDAAFAPAEYSLDNAAGTALFAYIMKNRQL